MLENRMFSVSASGNVYLHYVHTDSLVKVWKLESLYTLHFTVINFDTPPVSIWCIKGDRVH